MSNKCPECNKAFTKASFEMPDFVKCKCGFGISAKRMTEIVSDILNQRSERTIDNQEALNNL